MYKDRTDKHIELICIVFINYLCWSYGTPFTNMDYILIPAWISDHIPTELWIILLISSQTPTVAPLKFGNG